VKVTECRHVPHEAVRTWGPGRLAMTARSASGGILLLSTLDERGTAETV
jgi:hypothetical protein